jgi:AcrR family transcriptional regulator
MDTDSPYRHGNLSAALMAAARQILDEDGLPAVGPRETARRVGVSPMATYRHFASKGDLLASVAAEGFRELAAAIQSVTLGTIPFARAGLATSTSPAKIPAISRHVRARPRPASEISGAPGRDPGHRNFAVTRGRRPGPATNSTQSCRHSGMGLVHVTCH